MCRKLQILTFIFAFGSSLAYAASPSDQPIDTTELQRSTFLAAENALNQGQLTRYRELKLQLQDYPLLPYLDYQYLKKRLNRLPADQVEAFLRQYSDTPLHDRLLNAWLTTLSRRGQWQQFINTYEPSNNIKQQCMHRWAHYKTGNPTHAFTDIEKIWVVGRSQPRACDKLFSAWQSSEGMTTANVWDRFALAMQANKTRLARYLVRFLPENEQAWAGLWLKTRSRPQLIQDDQLFSRNHPMRNDILIYGVKRLAYRDLTTAVNFWDSLRQRYPFTDDQRNSTERLLALRHALKKEPDALGWLSSLPAPDINDPKIAEWRVRSALDQENWEAVLYSIEQLNDELQTTSRWQYWRARALEALGKQLMANELYGELAQNRGYYSFLAADRLGQEYHFDNHPIPTNINSLQQLQQLPGIQRAHELYKLDRIIDARREWLHTTSQLTEPDKQQAAAIAHLWGWHDRAILTLADTSYRDNLDLRFPLAFSNQISTAAVSNNIEPALAFALIRQESAFTADAQSHAGAIGLMQLMPRTAKQVANRLSIRIKNTRAALTDTETNLTLGMSHLRKILNRYQNNAVLAVAAYNAGAHRVKQWIPEQGVKAADIWTETIPFSETRNYVQNIMYFTTIYEQRLKNANLTTMTERMPPIHSPASLLATDTNAAAADPS